MPSSFIYKAEGERGKRGIFLSPQESTREAPYAILPDGTRINSKYINTLEGRNQFLFGDAILGQQGVKIVYEGKEIDLEDSNKSYEGNNPYDGWTYRNKGDLGSGGGGGMGGGSYPGSLSPFPFGAGMSPGYLGGQYPFFQPISYVPINIPDYDLLDPEEYGKKFGEFTRNELTKNFGTSKQFALEALDLELQNFKGYVPAASALKRSQTALDNLFNQAQRTTQIESTIPDILKNLKDQEGRAQRLLTGRLPNALEDEALSVAARSEAADASRSRGFGVGSGASTNLSDRLSARERLQISQYGEQLLSSNQSAQVNLRLAPTSYSQAGEQINVNPTVSPTQALSGFMNLATNVATIPAQQAFSGIINQRQFGANLANNVNQFNASNQLNTDMFNAENVYASQLGFFNYNQGFAANLAGLGTAEINQQREDAIRQELTAQFEDSKSTSQDRQTIQNILGALGQLPGVASIIGDILDIFGINPSSDVGDTSGGTGGGEPLDVDAPAGAIGQNSDGSYIYPDDIPLETGEEIVGTTPEGYTIYESSYTPPSADLDMFGVTQNGYSLGVDLNDFRQAMGFA